MQQHENFRHQHICCGMRCRFQKSDKNCTQFTYFQRNNRFIFQRPQIITIKAVFLRKKCLKFIRETTEQATRQLGRDRQKILVESYLSLGSIHVVRQLLWSIKKRFPSQSIASSHPFGRGSSPLRPFGIFHLNYLVGNSFTYSHTPYCSGLTYDVT